MIILTLKRIGWALVLLAVQVLILNHIHPWGYGAPLLCPIIIITLPMGTSRSAALLWGFIVGMAADIFGGTPGIGSAAMTFIALMQPVLLGLMSPRDADEALTPSAADLGRWNYTRFAALLLLLHHIVYFALEGFSYFHLTSIAQSMAVSYAASLALILAVEYFRNKKD